MKVLKDMVLAVKTAHKKKAMSAPLAHAVAQAEKFLAGTKTLEYTGPLDLTGSNIVKLVDIKTDLDDIIRAMNGYRENPKMPVYLCIVSFVKQEQVAAAKPGRTSHATTNYTPTATV